MPKAWRLRLLCSHRLNHGREALDLPRQLSDRGQLATGGIARRQRLLRLRLIDSVLIGMIPVIS